MPKSLRPLAPLLLLAACNSGAKLSAPKFAGPSALAVFNGYSSKHAGASAPRPYLAVANLLRDELTVVDPLDNELVLSTTLAFPLAVPTRPRPFKLAAAAVEPPEATERGADLLVVATQSPPGLQLVTTWTEELRAVDLPAGDDLAAAYPGTALLSLAAVARPGGGAWVLAGLSGGHLAVLEFERDPSSTLALSHRPVRRTSLPLQRKELVTGAGRFDPLDLAVAPDLSRVFVATTDPLQDGAGATISGVAQLTVGGAGASAAWPVVGLDARGPTRLVTAGVFAQRTAASSMVFADPSLQVMAVLDEESCGLRRVIDCGLVALLPDVGIAPDPAGELAYRAPIGFGATVSAMTLVMPRRGGDAGTPVGVSWAGAPSPVPDLMTLPASTSTVGTQVRLWQTALLAVALSDGRLVAVDPGRWGIVNATQRRDKDRRLLLTSVSTGVNVTGEPRLGLWNDVTGDGATLVTDGAKMHLEVRSTAGYLPDESFAVAWRGALPGLAGRAGMVQWDGTRAVAAIQVGAVAGAHLTDPELGVHVGDLVRVLPPSGQPCGVNGFIATITGILAPSAAYPGGALALSHAGDSAAGDGERACDEGTPVVGASAPGPVTSTVTVSSAGLVLTGNALGYLGRPTLNADFELRYRPEAGLSGEELVIARKLRRRLYSADGPCGAAIPGLETGTPPVPATFECDSPVVAPPGADPLTPGPALKFRLGCEGSACARPGTGASAIFNATSGLNSAVWRSPITLGVPTALASFDARVLEDSRSATFYAAFTTNEVLGVIPNLGSISSMR